LFAAFLLAGIVGCKAAPNPDSLQPSLVSPSVFVMGVGDTNTDCRPDICQHNENTDFIRWKGDIYFVHRTANSQILGPNSSLHFYKSTDEGKTFTPISTVLAPPQSADFSPDAGSTDMGFDAPTGRDIRDPAFFIVGDTLHIKTITRTPCPAPDGIGCPWDTEINSITAETHTTDGVNWSPLTQISPVGWGFWRVQEHNGVYYSVAYHDGDNPIALFTSADGVTWTQGPTLIDDPNIHPSETELVFLPSGRLMAIVRTDLTDEEGDNPAIQSQICFAEAPYSSFSCNVLDGVRLDGPVAFFSNTRLFVIARKHLGTSDSKRTALYELTGNLEGGPVGIKEWFQLPSAGDTSYAGAVALKDGNMLVSWYSSDVPSDPPWLLGIIGATNIWMGQIHFSAP
jgi:hypothetical protein